MCSLSTSADLRNLLLRSRGRNSKVQGVEICPVSIFYILSLRANISETLLNR